MPQMQGWNQIRTHYKVELMVITIKLFILFHQEVGWNCLLILNLNVIYINRKIFWEEILNSQLRHF